MGQPHLNQDFEFLSFRECERQYPGLLNRNTLRSWVRRRSWGFDKVVTRAGRSVRVRRDRLESWLLENFSSD